MATKIGVLTHQQPHGDPAYHVSRTEADRRIASGEADRLTHVLIRMRRASYAQSVEQNIKLRDLRRMKMPPAEVAGCRFDDPVKTPRVPRMVFLSAVERSQQCEV